MSSIDRTGPSEAPKIPENDDEMIKEYLAFLDVANEGEKEGLLREATNHPNIRKYAAAVRELANREGMGEVISVAKILQEKMFAGAARLTLPISTAGKSISRPMLDLGEQYHLTKHSEDRSPEDLDNPVDPMLNDNEANTQKSLQKLIQLIDRRIGTEAERAYNDNRLAWKDRVQDDTVFAPAMILLDEAIASGNKMNSNELAHLGEVLRGVAKNLQMQTDQNLASGADITVDESMGEPPSTLKDTEPAAAAAPAAEPAPALTLSPPEPDKRPPDPVDDPTWDDILNGRRSEWQIEESHPEDGKPAPLETSAFTRENGTNARAAASPEPTAPEPPHAPTPPEPAPPAAMPAASRRRFTGLGVPKALKDMGRAVTGPPPTETLSPADKRNAMRLRTLAKARTFASVREALRNSPPTSAYTPGTFPAYATRARHMRALALSGIFGKTRDAIKYPFVATRRGYENTKNFLRDAAHETVEVFGNEWREGVEISKSGMRSLWGVAKYPLLAGGVVAAATLFGIGYATYHIVKSFSKHLFPTLGKILTNWFNTGKKATTDFFEGIGNMFSGKGSAGH